MVGSKTGPSGVRCRAKPNSGEGDEMEGQENGHGALPYSILVFPRAHLSPKLVYGDAQAIESPPNHKVPARLEVRDGFSFTCHTCDAFQIYFAAI